MRIALCPPPAVVRKAGTGPVRPRPAFSPCRPPGSLSNARMARSDNLTGALLMMVAMAAFTVNDTILKSMAGDVPLYQLLFLRGIATSLAIGVIAWRRGVFRHRPSRGDRNAIGLRSLAEVAATYFYLVALFHMPLANVSAILQALPLTITLGAALFLGDRLGWRRMLAIAAGFCGVLLIVRPGAEGFTVHSLSALASVALATVRDLSTRRLTRETPSLMVTFTTSAGVMAAFGVASIWQPWEAMQPREVALISLSAVVTVVGYLLSVMVMRVGEVSFVAPFRYTGLIWALGLGWVVFGDWPKALTLLGAAIVVGSGLFTLYREARAGRKRSAARALHPR